MVNHFNYHFTRNESGCLFDLFVQLRTGTYSFSVDKRLVSYCGVEQHLTRKEAEVLRFMMMRAGGVCELGEIRSAVWRQTAMKGQSATSVVAHLQAKLPPGASDLIEIVDGDYLFKRAENQTGASRV
jgi:DNA-binding response OmpR family regulator